MTTPFERPAPSRDYDSPWRASHKRVWTVEAWPPQRPAMVRYRPLAFELVFLSLLFWVAGASPAADPVDAGSCRG